VTTVQGKMTAPWIIMVNKTENSDVTEIKTHTGGQTLEGNVC
jgi:hypothetical protein